MPKLMVNVAGRGTPLSDGGASETGHLWYELISDDGSVLSFGFAPSRMAVPMVRVKLSVTIMNII